MSNMQIGNRKGLPDFLPHGWKTEVAEILGVHRNTITNALKNKRGLTYNKVVKVAIEKWGSL